MSLLFSRIGDRRYVARGSKVGHVGTIIDLRPARVLLRLDHGAGDWWIDRSDVTRFR